MSNSNDGNGCECGSCDACNQAFADAEEERQLAEFHAAVIESTQREQDRRDEGGDDDDYDEEDPHGSRPIDSK